MVYYPLQLLQRAGVTEVLIVTGPAARRPVHRPARQRAGAGRATATSVLFDLDLSYKVQVAAGGIAQVVGMARDLRRRASSSSSASATTSSSTPRRTRSGAGRAARWSSSRTSRTPRTSASIAYGDDGSVADIVEKAGVVDTRYDAPPSTDAVVGLYCYPPDVFELIDGLEPSNRGELEITDVNRIYAQRGELEVRRVEGWWHDGGKHWADLADVGRLIDETGANK